MQKATAEINFFHSSSARNSYTYISLIWRIYLPPDGFDDAIEPAVYKAVQWHLVYSDTAQDSYYIPCVLIIYKKK